MYLKSKMRLLGMSALVGAGLLGTGPALAYTVNLGGVDVQIDSTMSVGSTWQIKESDSKFLPETNGGNAESNPIFDFVRDGNGAIKYYDPTLLTADGTPKYLSQTLAVREEAHVTIGGTNDLTAGTRVMSTASGAAVPTGGKPVLDYLNPNNCTPVYGGHCQAAPAALAYNFDGSINTDDGRLSFSKGDAVSAPVKIVTDIELSRGPVTGFFRVKGFYDAVLMDENNFERGADFTDDGEELTGAGIDLLDAYVSYDFDLGDLPATLRLGKQVINWGEATFIPGGNSAFNPIDVPAIRRPGAELKEAFLPVEALYGSIALTDTISVEAYVGGWDRYKLDVGGTFFAGSDSAEPGNNSGNPSDLFYVGGGPNSGTQWACDVDALTAAYPQAGALAAAINTASTKNPCAGSAAADILVPYTVGSTESERFAIDPTDGIDRLADDEGDESIGLAVRWYAENLNSTEFGFYYQKMDSRLPYVSYKSMPTQLKGSIAGGDASQVTRGAGLTGCFAAFSGGVAAMFGNNVTPDPDYVANLDFATAYYRPTTGDVAIKDPDGLIAAYGAATSFLNANGTAAVLSTAAGALGGLFVNSAAQSAILKEQAADAVVAENDAYAAPVVNSSAYLQYVANDATQNAERFGAGVVVYENVASLAAAQDTANGDTVWADAMAQTVADINAYAGSNNMADGAAGTVAAMQQANCAGTIGQAFGNLAQTGGHPFDSFGQVKSGAVSLGYTQNIALYLEHPEVETYGISFNTVLGGWGVQGDFSFRPDAPLQIDTDVLTINALFQNGAALGAGAAEASYTALEGYNGEFIGNPYSYQAGEQTIKGYVEHDVITWDIGTTATFTRSNPVIAALGADIGILLTEFQGLIVDGAEDRANPSQNLKVVPLSNVCTSGSDLALNSVLNIDQRATNGMCRPTDESSGMVLLARATWNNVLGTPVSMSPTVVFREGLNGYSPSPIGSWREGVGSTAASVGFDYLGKMAGSLSYVTYHGDDLRTKNGDRDHVSLSLTYSY
jgi:hypothetical protein